VNSLVFIPVDGTPRWMALGLTVMRFLIAAFFLFAASKNLSGDAAMVADFRRWGYPDWFRLLTAWLQVAGALLLLDRRIAFYGAVLLGCILLGAMATHLLHDPPVTAAAPVVFLIPVAAFLVGYRPPLLR
jgi:hypothetical protein